MLMRRQASGTEQLSRESQGEHGQCVEKAELPSFDAERILVVCGDQPSCLSFSRQSPTDQVLFNSRKAASLRKLWDKHLWCGQEYGSEELLPGVHALRSRSMVVLLRGLRFTHTYWPYSHYGV